MLTVAGLQKAFGARLLFDDVSLTLQAGERIGLVGPNGAGKSTLLKIILGCEPPDAGEVTFIRGTRLGYLPQESEPGGAETVLDLAAPSEPDHAPDGQTLARAKQILARLGFRQTDFTRPARELSGGWVMRARLARLLVEQPDALLLDEPTNHLDLETLLWVQDYLRAYRGGLLLISHDREFLNQLCTHIVELRQGRLLRYTGNYDAYLEQRTATEQTLQATHRVQLREIERLQNFVDRFRAKNTKATQAQSKLKQIERLRAELIEAPAGPEATVGFTFPQPVRSGQRVLTLTNVGFAYGGTPVYDGLDFAIERGQRMVLVGPNGAGKSTLLKLLAGVLTPQTGQRQLGYHVHLGYYAQHRVTLFHAGHSVLEEAMDTPRQVGEQFVRTVLGSFLFRGDDVFKPVRVLSGGEKSRLALVKLLLNPPNLLLMDEPTTHLDLASVDALIEALTPYTGTLVFISHDVHFIRAMADHVVRIEAGRPQHFPGGYEYYLHKTALSARDGLTRGGAVSPAGEVDAAIPLKRSDSNVRADRKMQRRHEAEARQARSRQRRAVQQRVHQLEQEIADLEARERTLVAALELPETYATPGRAVEINEALRDLHARLPAATAEWEAAATELAELDTGTE